MTRIGIIQTKDHASNAEAIEKTGKILANLGKKGAEIVCFPEQWLVDNKIQDYEKEFMMFKKIAKEYSMTVIPGAFYDISSKKVSINSPIIGPNGEIVGAQEKIHPFDYEGRLVKQGTEAKVFRTSCKFGVIICYDMVFPAVVKKMAEKGAEVILSPSRIVRRGINPWHTYVQARSLENRIPIFAANVENRKFGGSSIIVDLKEDRKVMLSVMRKLRGESGAIKDIDLRSYASSRKQRFADARKFH